VRFVCVGACFIDHMLCVLVMHTLSIQYLYVDITVIHPRSCIECNGSGPRGSDTSISVVSPDIAFEA